MKKLVLSAALFFAFTAQAANYKLDPAHTIVGFSVKHLVVSKVRGRFNKFEGSFGFDEKKNEATKIDVKIEVASIDTNDKKRDEHLASPDFFDAKKFPEIRFKSDKPVTVKKDQVVKVSGDLTMHGVTKPVTLDLTYGGAIKDPYGNEKVGFTLNGQVDRKEFGIKWNKALEAGGMTVGDDVTIEIEGEAQKDKEAGAAAPAPKK
jgi:polyisoprenoid-binding protein YceI